MNKPFLRIVAVFVVLLVAVSMLPSNANALTVTEGVITAKDVAMRAAADDSSKIIMRLPKGAVVQIKATNVNAQWYKVVYQNKTGYVNRVYVDWDSSLYDLNYTGTICNVKQDANVRTEPSNSSILLGVAKKDDMFTVLQANAADGWHKISYNGKTGYIKSKYLKLAVKANDTQLTSLTISAGTIAPQFSPSESGYMVTTNTGSVTVNVTANKGVTVKMNDKETKSYRVDIPDGGMKSVRIAVGNNIAYTVYIMRNVVTIGTWNIKRGNGRLLEQGRLIRDQMPDLMGLQEVYVREAGSNITNNLLSLKTKHMSYTRFCETMNSGSSQYGHGILSAYKILSNNVYKLSSPGVEQRYLSKTEVNISGKRVSFYNTHLSYQSASIRSTQFKEIAAIMKQDKNKYKILVGDFNADYVEFAQLGSYRVVNTPDTKYYDYSKREISFNEIDNIILTKNIRVVNTRIVKTNISDHAPVFAYIVLK